MRRALTTILGLGALLWTSSAAAWVPTGFRWRNLPVQYEVNTASSVELGRDTTLQVLADSYAAWEAPGCSGYRAQLTRETNGGWSSRDRVNTHVWIYDPAQRPRELGGRSTIGVTLSVSSGQDAFDGDILYNGIDHDWTTAPRRGGDVDAQSIITHETGHQLGLSHSPLQQATMYAAYLGGTGSRTLDADDINGVCSLYPSGAAPDCARDADCAGAGVCVNGACVAGGGNGDVGDPCGPGGECGAGNFCVGTPEGDTFCTRQCGGGCPQAWACERVQFQNNQVADICLPGAEAPAQGSAGFGQPCEGAPDCASGLCVYDGQTAFCSQSCANDANCPAGGECAELQGGGGACVPGADPRPRPATPPARPRRRPTPGRLSRPSTRTPRAGLRRRRAPRAPRPTRTACPRARPRSGPADPPAHRP
ncbi:MAG: matrixin family metalloprotease [Myxococcales bacterium]|nr:matrixin family metalloprotease [Myxococcales bacterium]